MAAGTKSLLTLLKKIAYEQNCTKADIKISPVSTGGANFTSTLYSIKITSHGKDLQLFAKIAALGEKIRELSYLEPYDNERFMYTELVKIYRGLEEKCNLSNEHKLAVAKYYGADATRLQETLVLEDLSSQGFAMHDRMQPVSWQYAAAAVTELAKFHALSLAFQHYNPTEFDKVANIFQHGMFIEHEESDMFWNSSVQTAMTAVREVNKEKLRRFLAGSSMVKYSGLFRALRRTVLIHADFRPTNILHRSKKDGSIELVVVDYQTIQTGCPVIDLLQFIFSATDGQFRAQHYQELVDCYHAELGAALARLGLDVDKEYSRQYFEFELKEKLSYGLHQTVLFLHLLFIKEDEAPLLQEVDMASLAVQATGDQYARRLNEVVDDYVAWGVLV